MDTKLQRALDLLWHWIPREQESKFWPKEETLQGWFAACLVETGYAAHPTQVMQELHLGEAKNDNNQLEFNTNELTGTDGPACWQFDLTVIADQPTGGHGRPIRFLPGVRDLERLRPPHTPKLLVEIKALNSAR